MSIIVTLEDRDGELIGRVLEIRTLNRLFANSSNCCLPHISELEDAMFNRSQLPALKMEIDSLEPAAEDEKTEWTELKSMVSHAERKSGLYLKFYGDPDKS